MVKKITIKERNMLKELVGLVFIIFFLHASFTWIYAEENKIELEKVVVTASREEEPLSEVTTKISVISKEEVQKSGVLFISDLLRKLSQLYLTSNGGPGQQAGIIMARGATSRHTLILVDSVRVNDPTLGMYNIGNLKVEDIERIEIIEGPQSSIYGSEAMGGVINIITKRGKGKPEITFSLRGGSYGTFNPSIEVSGEKNIFNFRITGSYFKTDGFSALKEGKERDGSKINDFSGKFGFKVSPKLNFEFSGKNSYSRTEFDLSPTTENALLKKNVSLFIGKIEYLFFERWKQTFTISQVRSHRKYYYKDFDMFSDYKTLLSGISWRNEITYHEVFDMRLGFDYQEEEGKYSGVYDADRDHFAIHINPKLKLFKEKLILTFTLREDDYKKFGDKETFRVGISYLIPYLALRIKANYGTGFRAPTLDDIYYQDPWGNKGNPDLKPEESRGWDIGFEKTFLNEKVFLEIVFFNQKYKNLIQWVEIAPWTYQPQNIGKAKIKGFEISSSYKILKNMHLYFDYTYLDTEDRDTKKYLIYKPEHRLGLGLEISFKNLTTLINYIYTSKRYVDPENVYRLKPYHLLNLSLRYSLNDRISLQGRLENLLNSNYEEVKGYSTSDRVGYLGMSFIF